MRRYVLIVEDDTDTREAFADALSDQGIDVTAMANGKEALQFLKLLDEPLPRLILLDLMMPVMGGSEFVAELRADPRLANLPVVLATAYRTDKMDFDVGKIHAALTKPVDLGSLLDIVRRFC